MNMTGGSYSSCYLYFLYSNATAPTAIYSLSLHDALPISALGQTGTYTIFIDPQGAATGGVTVQLNNESGVADACTAGTAVARMTTTAGGQDARLTFSGTAGQRVSLAVTNVTNPTAYVYLV